MQRVGSLQPRHLDGRIVSATNRNLLEEVQCGRFRSDLFYRLIVVTLHVPPLRWRREDIPYLTATFVKAFATAFTKPLTGVSAGAERLLMSAAWPGNVRELRNCLERACMLADGAIPSEEDIQSALPAATTVPTREAPAFGDDLKSVERDHIVRVLAQAGGSKAAAARRLGISRRALYRRLAFHNLALPPH